MARTRRIETLLTKMRAQKRYASIEQARIITRSYQMNEGAPRILQRALALKAALMEIGIAIEPEDTRHLLEGVRFMDSNECQTTIPAGRDTVGLTPQEIVEQLRAANVKFAENADEFRRKILANP